MSFFSGNSIYSPGPLTGNPMNGLCEKACIRTKKVFDACMKQIQENDVQITVTDYTPASPVQPLTFVGCTALTDQVTLTGVTVDRFDDKPCFARVAGTITLPIQISYTDANGTAGTATGNITINQDVVLYVPQASIVPFAIEAFANMVCSDGEYVGNGVFSIDACITVIMRVVVEAELLVPTYGYAQIPPCQDFSQDVCSGFFELPLYPAQQPVEGINNGR